MAQDNLDSLNAVEPDEIDGISDRAQDIIDPLLSIATRIGDECLQAARQAFVGLLAAEASDEGDFNEMLLSDIRDYFQNGQDSVFSRDLVNYLHGLEDRPWLHPDEGRPLDQRKLARTLTYYGIKSRTVWRKGAVPPSAKGYALSDLEDSFERYLPPVPVQEATERPSVSESHDLVLPEVVAPPSGERDVASSNLAVPRPSEIGSDLRSLGRTIEDELDWDLPEDSSHQGRDSK